MKKVLVVMGTRPEVIKLAPVVYGLRQASDSFVVKICDTGQHQEIKQSFLDFFHIKPDYQLDALGANTNLAALTAYLLTEIASVIQDFQPDLVIVQGDTTSALAGAWAAYYAQKKIVHLEAGLRTQNKYAPFPEEMNRQVIARLTDLHFAPTDLAVSHLQQEGIEGEKIFLVGNTIIDALYIALERIESEVFSSIESLKNLIEALRQQGKKMVLLTLHRRENLQYHLPEIGQAILNIIQQEDCFVLFPVHLNPAAQQWAKALATDEPRLIRSEPLSYEAFIWAMQQCDLILTDSGGIQEEAPSFGKPVIVLREHTERSEAIKPGMIYQVSVERSAIEKMAGQLLTQEKPTLPAINPFGDGKSGDRILEVLKSYAL